MKFLCGAFVALALVAPNWAGEKLTVRPRLVGDAVNISTYLPDSTSAVATMRMAELLKKLPIEKQLARMPLIDGMTKQLGFCLQDVEQLTLALPMLDIQSLMMVFTLKEPLDQDVYLKDNFPDAKPDATKKYFFSEAKTTCVCFLDKRTLLLTANDQIMQLCMQQAANKKRTPAFATVLKQAADHDFYFWLNASVITNKEALPIPAGLDAFSFAATVGDTLQLRVCAECEDEAVQEWAKKILRGSVDALRAQLLMMTAMGLLADVLPDSAKDMGAAIQKMGLPMKLMTVAEQGLQKAEIKTEGTQVTLTASIPLDAKALRPELLGLLRLLENTDGMIFATTKTAGYTLPSPHYLNHPPQTLTPTEPFPMPREAANPIPAGTWSPVPPSSPLPPPTLTPAPSAPSPLPALPPNALPSVTPLPPPTLPAYPYVPTPLPPSTPPSSSVVPVAAMVPMEITITVANTCDGEIPIYEVLPSGEYKHIATVDKGESSDLKLKIGQRYLAIRPGNKNVQSGLYGPPQLVTYTPEKANDIWLLRLTNK